MSASVRIGLAGEGGVPIPAGAAAGDLVYWDGAAWVPLAIGAAGEVLTVVGGLPAWAAAAAAGIDSVLAVDNVIDGGNPLRFANGEDLEFGTAGEIAANYDGASLNLTGAGAGDFLGNFNFTPRGDFVQKPIGRITATPGYTTAIAAGNSQAAGGIGGTLTLDGGSGLGSAGAVEIGGITTAQVDLLAATAMPDEGATLSTVKVFTHTRVAGIPTGAAPDGSVIYDKSNNVWYRRTAGAWVADGASSSAPDQKHIKTSTLDTVSSTGTPVTIASMTYTPPAGTWGVHFEATAEGSGNLDFTYGVYIDGTLETDTSRTRSLKGGDFGSVSVTAQVTTTGTEVVDVRATVNTNSADLTGRSFTFTKVTAI